MKKTIFTLFAACFATALSATVVDYTADDATIFPNPERGFITMLERHANKRYAVKGKESYLTNLKTNDKGTLVLVSYYLDEFKNKGTLPDTILSSFDEDMAVLRNYGMKCILRFAYTNESYEKVIKPGDTIRTAADAPLEIIKQHLDQYKSHWQANADVIFCFQAGFVGQYGEWYYTDNFGNTADTINSERKAFMDTLLNATPQNRFVMLRTPLFKTGYLDSISVSSAALTAEEAYKPTAKARLGQHNDAFLNGPKNQGTYKDTATQKPWLAQETLYVPIGGECNITKADTATKYASYEATTAEMSRLHWTFIQSGYAETTTNMWRTNGTFDELNRRLGYRFQLVSGTYGEAVTVGNNLSVNVSIKNVGYAPLYNERHAYIVLKNENATYPLQLSVDPRTWKPGSSAYTINQTLTVPNSVYNGTYDLYLWLPDEYASLRDKPAYAIRLANADVWDSETGFNALGAQVTVSGGSDAPEPVDTSIPLPATLNKANVTNYSEDMTWYGANDEYFDFGPNDKSNLGRWAEWEVNLRYPGNYNVSATGYYPNGHEWAVILLNSEADTLHFTRTWSTGELTENSPSTWNLSSPKVPAGIYTIQVKNVFPYSRPKLLSLTLEYDGEIPSGMEEAEEGEQTNKQAYDLLGRPVNDDYKGIVIMRGKKILR